MADYYRKYPVIPVLLLAALTAQPVSAEDIPVENEMVTEERQLQAAASGEGTLSDSPLLIPGTTSADLSADAAEDSASPSATAQDEPQAGDTAAEIPSDNADPFAALTGVALPDEADGLSDETMPDETLPDETLPEETLLPDETLPDEDLPADTDLQALLTDGEASVDAPADLWLITAEDLQRFKGGFLYPLAVFPEEAYPLWIRYGRLLHTSPADITLSGPSYGLLSLIDLPAPEKAFFMLRRSLEKTISEFDGTWSVYVEDLHSGETILIGDETMPSASEMKLFILGCTYEAIDRGELERTSELVAQFTSMIKNSSNEDANKILYKLGGGDYAAGIARVNTYIEENGYSEKTRAYNPFQNESLVLDKNHANTTSAADCGLFLSRVYHRQLGRRRICNEVEETLLAQTTRYKIPKAIPDGSLVGNKTGETDTVENDAAIVYTPAGDYILCVLSTGWKDKKLAQSRITQLSASVYSYYMGEDFMKNYISQMQ